MPYQYLYAAISRLTFKRVIGAVFGTDMAGFIPNWMNLEISGFDIAACNAGMQQVSWLDSHPSRP